MTNTTETADMTLQRPPAVRKRLLNVRPRIPSISKAEATALKSGSSTCVYFAGATEAVPRFLGDATGVTPFFMGRSRSWTDVVTSTLDRYSPTFAQSLWFRLWLPTPEAAKQVEAELPRHLSNIAKKLRGKAFDLDPTITLEHLQREVIALANSLGLEAFDDKQMLARLRKEEAQLNDQTAQARQLSIDDKNVQFDIF